MFKLKMLGLTVGALLGTVALAGTAFAATDATLKVGPVPIPSVPVELCVSQTDVPLPGTCVSTPSGQSVSLLVNAKVLTPTVGVVPPTIRQVPCPGGTEGVAAQVTTGSAAATVGGSASIGVNGGAPITVPVAPTVATAGKAVTVFACAGLS
jgi:hypothetical protein